LTFAALTGRKTLTDLFAIESAIEHISVAHENELMAIAPATADLIAKLAHGLADDFLTTLYLAFTGPVVVAPAMNSNMWRHPRHPGQPRDTAPARSPHRRTGERLPGVRDDRSRPAGGSGGHRGSH